MQTHPLLADPGDRPYWSCQGPDCENVLPLNRGRITQKYCHEDCNNRHTYHRPRATEYWTLKVVAPNLEDIADRLRRSARKFRGGEGEIDRTQLVAGLDQNARLLRREIDRMKLLQGKILMDKNWAPNSGGQTRGPYGHP